MMISVIPSPSTSASTLPLVDIKHVASPKVPSPLPRRRRTRGAEPISHQGVHVAVEVQVHQLDSGWVHPDGCNWRMARNSALLPNTTQSWPES